MASSGYPMFHVVDTQGNIINTFGGNGDGSGTATEAKQTDQVQLLQTLVTELQQKTEPAQSQSVNGLVVADQGEAGIASQGWFVRLTDGNTILGSSNNPLVVRAKGGSLEVSNFPAVQEVAGTVTIAQFPTVQPVNGTVTVGNLPNQSFLTHRNFSTLRAASVKTGAGVVFAVSCSNLHQNERRYLQLFDKALAPAVGDTPIESFAIGADSEVEKNLLYFGPKGLAFTNGLAWGISLSAFTFAPALIGDHLTVIKYL